MNSLYLFIIISIIVFYFIIKFNIFRYINLHLNSDDNYIKNYKKLHKCIEQRVVISLTTTPERIQLIKPVLKSLLDQTVRVDKIILNIPKECKGEKYNIPSEINDMCNVYNCGRDYGPGTKFIPTILRETQANTILILLDDDYIYGKDFIKTIINHMQENPETAICSKEAIALKPEYLDTNVIYTKKKYIDNNWIKRYIKSKIKDFNYENNLRSYYI